MKKIYNPIYIDGKFSLFSIIQDVNIYPSDFLKKESLDLWFEELSVFDKLKFEFEQRDIALSMKIRIPQYKKIDSMNVVLIEGMYHQVYSAAHFTNKDGFKQTDLTLVKYSGEIVFEEDL